MFSNFSQQLATVSWNEKFREGAFVFCRRGTGETGWWHQHDDDDDYGGNPMDFRKDTDALVCRTGGS